MIKSLTAKNTIKTLPYRALKSLWLLICLCVLSLGLVGQQRFKRAVLFPVIMVCISAVFIALRLFSAPLGIVAFTVLLLISYLLYWFDWLRLSSNPPITHITLFISVAFLFFNCAIFIALAYYSTSITGYRIYHIPTMSMSPNILPGDYVLVDLWHYKRQLAQKGEVVVFHHPFKQQVYIKRVTKTPNERFLNKKLPDRTYVVLGDNVNNSEDSRVFGSIKHVSLIGKANYILFAFDSNNQLNTKRLFYSL